MAEFKLAKTFDTHDGGCACVYSTHSTSRSQQNSTQILYVQAGPCPCPDIHPGSPPGGSQNADSDGINFVNKLLEPVRDAQPTSEIDVECGCYTGDGNFTKWIVAKPNNITSQKLCLDTSSSLPCVGPDEKYVGPPTTITGRDIFHVYKRDGYRLNDSLVLCYVGSKPVYKKPQIAQVKSLESGCVGITKVTIIERSAQDRNDFRYKFLSDSAKNGVKSTFEEMLMNVIKNASVEDGELDLGRDLLKINKGDKNPNVRKKQVASERADRDIELLTAEIFLNHSPNIKKRVLTGYMACKTPVPNPRHKRIIEEATSVSADAEAILDLIDTTQISGKILELLTKALPLDVKEVLLAEAERVEASESEELNKLQEVLLSAALSESVLVSEDVDRGEEDGPADEQAEAQKIEGDTIREERAKIPQIQKEEAAKAVEQKVVSAKQTKELRG